MASEFEQACKSAARDLRRMPKDLKKEAGREVQAKVAEPLANAIRAAARGGAYSNLYGAIKARIDVDPKITIGGATPRLRGGASPKQVVYGREFGGGTRRTAQVTSTKGKTFIRKSTKQFINTKSSFIYPTFRAQAGQTLERWISILDPFLERWQNNG